MKESEVLYWHLKKHIVRLIYVQLIFGQTWNVGLLLQRMKTEQEDRQVNPFSMDEFKTKISTLRFQIHFTNQTYAKYVTKLYSLAHTFKIISGNFTKTDFLTLLYIYIIRKKLR